MSDNPTTNKVFNQLLKDFGMVPGDNKSFVSQSKLPTKECVHEFKLYEGFTDTYEYCTKCDKRKSDIKETAVGVTLVNMIPSEAAWFPDKLIIDTGTSPFPDPPPQYRLDPDGLVEVSYDGGKTWEVAP